MQANCVTEGRKADKIICRGHSGYKKRHTSSRQMLLERSPNRGMPMEVSGKVIIIFFSLHQTADQDNHKDEKRQVNIRKTNMRNK